MSYSLLSENPVPVWIVNENHKPSSYDAPVDRLEEQLAAEGDWPIFRGVSIDRLPTVVTTGVDVEPTDKPIYCSDIEKASEYGRSPYGQSPRIIFALRRSMLERSFRQLPLDATPSEIAETRQIYPHPHDSAGSLWFSRIAERNRNLVYEAENGYWIPGDAKDALVAIFLLVPPDQIDHLLHGVLEGN